MRVHDSTLVADDAGVCPLHLIDRFAADLAHAFDDHLQARHAGL